MYTWKKQRAPMQRSCPPLSLHGTFYHPRCEEVRGQKSCLLHSSWVPLFMDMRMEQPLNKPTETILSMGESGKGLKVHCPKNHSEKLAGSCGGILSIEVSSSPMTLACVKLIEDIPCLPPSLFTLLSEAVSLMNAEHIDCSWSS